MNKPLLIKDVTTLAAFEPAIKLQAISADLRNRYFKDYILTQDLASVYEKILSSVVGDGWGSTTSTLAAERRRSHLISAQYGTGKSYFLMILSALLGAGGDPAKLQTAKDKFGAFPEVLRLLSQLSDKKFLVIQISAEDKGDIRFKELLVRNVLNQVARIVSDAVFSNEYTEAVNHLEEIEASPIGPALAHVLDAHFGMSLQQLRARLGHYDRDGLRTYYQACERTMGRKVSRDVLGLESTLQEALDLLKPKGYTHIAVLVDELTAYLHASAGHHSLAETLGEMQAFAAYCNNPVTRCLFVGAMHVSVQAFLQDLSQQRDFDKMRGRFDEHPFPVYSSKLLAGVFQPKQPTFDLAMQSYRGQVRELTDLITTFQLVDDGRPIKLAEFFPLHPATAYYLPRVSRELGQAERTSFGFIDEVVRHKLGESLAKEGRLNLVTLDELFEYFLPAMEQKEYYQQVITAYNAVRSKIPDPLAHQAFKPLVLLWIASRVRSAEAQYLQIDLSAQQVADFIGVEDDRAVREVLESLCTTGYIYFDRSTQKFFYSHADPGWDLESEIHKEMVTADANKVLSDELQALGLGICLNVPNTMTIKVDRSVEAQWMSMRQLEESRSIKPKQAEGKVVFIVPDFAEVASYEAKFSDVSMKARDLSTANTVVAVPKRVDMLNQAELRRYRALQEIRKRIDVSREGSVNEHRVRVVKARFAEVQARVRRDIEAFGRETNFIFFINRQPQEAQDLKTILVDMFERYYYKFPKVKAERINGRGTTNALIDACIVNPQTSFASDSSEVARHARDTLQVLGLCSWERGGGGKYNVELREPISGSEGYEIWKIVLDTLTDVSGSPFAALYKRLSEAPFGLPEYMVELYIAAARALKKIYILDKGGKMPTVSKALVADITRRKDRDYRVVAVQETEVPYTFICSVWEAIDEPLGLRHYQELEKNLGRSVDDQKTWFALKADSNNLLQNRLSQVSDSLKSTEAESASFAALTKHLEQIRRLLIPTQGFAQLATLGHELSGKNVRSDPDTAAQVIRLVIEASEQFLKDWGAFYPTYQQYIQLRSSSQFSRFAALAQGAEDAYEAYRLDALSVEKRQAFVKQFKKLWEQYTEQYVDEHNAVAKARANYGKKAEKSLAYELVGEFSQFAYGGIATKSSFDTKLKEVRKQSCHPLSQESMLDYRKFGRASCACNYRIGTAAQILAQLQESEDSLATSVDNALDSYLATLQEWLSSESIRLYTVEKATTEERVAVTSLGELVTKRLQLNETQYRRLKALLPEFRRILPSAQSYFREQARKRKDLEQQLEEEERQKRIPRLATKELAEEVRTFLMNSGLESMTLKELETQLENWIQEVARRFKQPA